MIYHSEQLDRIDPAADAVQRLNDFTTYTIEHVRQLAEYVSRTKSKLTKDS